MERETGKQIKVINHNDVQIFDGTLPMGRRLKRETRTRRNRKKGGVKRRVRSVLCRETNGSIKMGVMSGYK